MAFVYTKEELDQVIAQYLEGISLEDIASKYNKSVASVRMKLVKQGVYVKQVKSAKATTIAAVPPTWKERFDEQHGLPPF